MYSATYCRVQSPVFAKGLSHIKTDPSCTDDRNFLSDLIHRHRDVHHAPSSLLLLHSFVAHQCMRSLWGDRFLQSQQLLSPFASLSVNTFNLRNSWNNSSGQDDLIDGMLQGACVKCTNLTASNFWSIISFAVTLHPSFKWTPVDCDCPSYIVLIEEPYLNLSGEVTNGLVKFFLSFTGVNGTGYS